PMTFRLYAIPEWGIEVGISKKLPSSRDGINSLPIPGKVWVKVDQTLESLTFHPIFSAPVDTNPKMRPNPNQTFAPSRISKAGIIRNFTLWSRHHLSMLL